MKKYISISGNQLKILALLSMICDHVAIAFFYENEYSYELLRIIGRISFPIFAFMLYKGFEFTSNRKKYLIRILLFAIISEIPFDLFLSGKIIDLSQQNVMFTLFLGFLMMWIMEEWGHIYWIKYGSLVLFCILAWLIRCDYTVLGILIIACFYLLEVEGKMYQVISFTFFVLMYGGLESYALMSIPFWVLYSPEKKEKLLPKYLFYILYPLHLMILYILGKML